MTESSSARGPLACRWHLIVWEPNTDPVPCNEPSTMLDGKILMCRQHNLMIARLMRFIPRHEVHRLIPSPRNFDLTAMEETIRTQANTIRHLEAKRQRPTVPKDGVVYYLRVGANIKIGWTSDLGKRMKAYSPDSVLLATEPGRRDLETRRHRAFAAHRTHGREWYAMVPSLMHHIDGVTVKHGTPDAVAFAAKPVTIPQPRRRETIGRSTGLVWKVS